MHVWRYLVKDVGLEREVWGVKIIEGEKMEVRYVYIDWLIDSFDKKGLGVCLSIWMGRKLRWVELSWDAGAREVEEIDIRALDLKPRNWLSSNQMKRNEILNERLIYSFQELLRL
jgi:hypothetical protein